MTVTRIERWHFRDGVPHETIKEVRFLLPLYLHPLFGWWTVQTESLLFILVVLLIVLSALRPLP
jgi:hypothetical protein